MTFPTFTGGEVLDASDMNAIGLWLVKTQAVGSAVPDVEVTGAFSSDYDNYLVTLEGCTVSTSTSIGIHLGASTTGYYGFLNYGATGSNSPQGAQINNAVRFLYAGGGNTGQNAHVYINVFGPNKARYTKFIGGAYQDGTNYGAAYGEHQVATAFTAFTLTPGSGTLTGGTIRVYGYRN